jgi:hypothetical protein
MTTAVRSSDPRFLDDIKKILGDMDGVLRTPPTRGELEAYGRLCGLLWGYAGGNPGPAELESVLAGHLRLRAERIEVQFAHWGGELVELLPVPKRTPPCRIWMLKQGRTEYLIAMTNAEGIPEGHYPELNAVVGPRARERFPGSYIEQLN